MQPLQCPYDTAAQSCAQPALRTRGDRGGRCASLCCQCGQYGSPVLNLIWDAFCCCPDHSCTNCFRLLIEDKPKGTNGCTRQFQNLLLLMYPSALFATEACVKKEKKALTTTAPAPLRCHTFGASLGHSSMSKSPRVVLIDTCNKQRSQRISQPHAMQRPQL